MLTPITGSLAIGLTGFLALGVAVGFVRHIMLRMGPSYWLYIPISILGVLGLGAFIIYMLIQNTEWDQYDTDPLAVVKNRLGA